MSIAITAAERDALYGRIAIRLNGIDAVYNAVEGEDWEAAQKLGREFSDLLRLVCEDLGWGEAGSGTSVLATPPDVLGRAVGVVRGLARSDRSFHDEEARVAQQKAGEARQIEEACERILGQLA